MEPVNYLALSAITPTDFARSALPDAPVVPFDGRPERGRRARTVLAGSLYRLGDAVAPAGSHAESITVTA